MITKFVNKVAAYVENVAVKAFSSSIGNTGLMRFGMRGNRTVLGRESGVDLVTAFKAWSGVCIKKRSRAIAQLKWKIKLDQTQEEAVDLPNDHWLVKLFSFINPNYTQFDFFDYMEKWFCGSGNVFIWTPVLEGDKYPRQMWVLPTNTIQIRLSNEPGKLIDGFIFTIAGQLAWLDADEVIHIRNLVPSNDPMRMIVGYPLINMAAESIIGDAELTEFIKRYLQNDGIQPVVVTSEGGNVKEGAYEAMRDSLMEKMPKLKILGLLKGGMKLMPAVPGATTSNSNIQITTALDSINKENICAAFDLRRSQITGDNTSYENADANDYSFRLDAIDSQAVMYGQAFTKHFKKYDETIYIEHVEFVRKDPRLDIEKKTAFGFNINDELKAQGRPTIGPKGDVFVLDGKYQSLDTLLAAAKVATPSKDATPEENPPVVEDTKKPEPKLLKSVDAETEKKLVKLWKSKDTLREKHEILLKRGFIFALDDLLKSITNKLDKAFKNKKVGNDEHGLEVSDLFDLEEWVKTFEDAVTDDEMALITDAARQAAKECGENWDDIHSDFDKELQQTLTKVTGKMVRTPLSTIAEEMDELLKANPSASKAKLVELITARFEGIYTQSRINTIATTTATYAINNTQMRVWHGLGFKRKVLTQRDGKVRSKHRKADGQKEDEDGMFTIGGEKMEHPGAGSDPDNNIGCRCYTMVDGEV